MLVRSASGAIWRDRFRRFVHPDAFTCERGFVGAQAVCFHEARIGRDFISVAEAPKCRRDDLAGVHLPPDAVADHGCFEDE